MISTRDLSLLPDVDSLRRTLRAMAMLDAILCREWQFRYYSFNTTWAAGEQMGSMRNGSGDEFFAYFGSAGCWLKGFAHEYPMTPYRENPLLPWPGVLDTVPAEFAACWLSCEIRTRTRRCSLTETQRQFRRILLSATTRYNGITETEALLPAIRPSGGDRERPVIE